MLIARREKKNLFFAANLQEMSSHLPISDNLDGSHTVATAIFQRKSELLLWVDMFSGYVIAKASSSRTAQTIAESYEECVF